MNFIDALRKCGGSMERTRAKVVDLKDITISDRVKIYRPEWRKIKYPAQYVWVTSQNIPVVSVGNNQSVPMMLEVSDLLADDWEVINVEDDGAKK